VTLVLSCTVSEISQLLLCSCPHPYSTLILGVFPLHQIAHVGVSKRIGLKLFGGEIIFEEFQPMWSRYLKRKRCGQTDRQTTCNLITALCVALKVVNIIIVIISRSYTVALCGRLLATYCATRVTVVCPSVCGAVHCGALGQCMRSKLFNRVPRSALPIHFFRHFCLMIISFSRNTQREKERLKLPR